MKLPVLDEGVAKAIRQAETDYFASRIGSIGERSGNPEGVEIKNFGSSTAFYIRTMPWGLFNSVKGFSRDDLERTDEIIAFYRERNRKFQLDVDPGSVDPQSLALLARKGLYQESFHSVLYGLPRPEPPELPPNIDVREIRREDDFDLYAGIHCVGAGMAIEHKRHFANNNAGLLHRPGWRLFLACLEGEPAAVAVMHASGGIASLALAATVPEFRRNGLQAALLQWRMHEAHKAGCRLVAAQASFESSSRRNMERCGMRTAWTRAVWAPLHPEN